MKILQFNPSCDVVIGRDLLSDVLLYLRDYDRAVLITDEGVAAHHLAPLVDRFADQEMPLLPIVLPSGEGTKSFSRLEELMHRFASENLTKQDVVIAFGGGVVSDLAGLAAAVYKRGIDHVVIPTTLLSQLDASLGGKTAINLPAGKNLVGVIHHPKRVFADLAYLDTLAEKEKRNGIGELVKHGLLDDQDLLGDLESAATIEDLFTEEIVHASLVVKRKFVHDLDLSRDVLNFGHTLGHAIEAVTGYGPIGHGEAVMQGMVLMLLMTGKEELAKRVQVLSERFGFPDFVLPSDREAFFDALMQDKKRHGYLMDVIVLDALGSPRVEAVALDVLTDRVEGLFARMEAGDAPWR